MSDSSRGTSALRTGRKQRVTEALEVLVGAVEQTQDQAQGRIPRGIVPAPGAALVTGEAALLLRASEGLATDPGVRGARVRLAAVAGEGTPDVGAVDDGAHETARGWLHEALAGPASGGSDRGPGVELERAWIRGVWSGDFSGLDDERLLARSALGRPVDTLLARTDDLYALTRAALVATDLGRRPTSARVTVGEAEAALALALDVDDLVLAAEVLWLWPMLRLPWTPPAGFALRLVDAALDVADHRSALAYGVLCSVLSTARIRRARPATSPVLALPAPGRLGPRWSVAYRQLPLVDRSALAPVVLTAVVSRAHRAHDLAALRTAVKVAFNHGLLDSPAASQAASVVRRASNRSASHVMAG